ncbi:unnamed protein product [Caenorhabditis angaria]|uniref:Decapping nuclease n=1 Tax=Caenorhabditis angaria TaxID=860376 RepID=A0A9P1MSX2_9PELO|nr:unnamed protein product [Caenorhabditis angaria]
MLDKFVAFEYVGCYQSDVRTQCFGKRKTFNVEINIGAPFLHTDLIPEKLNSVKKLEEEDILDITAYRNEKYVDDGSNEKLESILQFIEKMESDEKNLKMRIKSDIICNRGLLYKLGCMGNLKLRAVRRKNVIFMCLESKKDTARDTIHSHSALKFEKMITDDETFMKTSRNFKNLRSGLRRKIVQRMSFDSATVLSSAEIDARDKDGNSVEIKLVWKDLTEDWYEKKSLKVYLQCYMANTKQLLIGKIKQREKFQFVVDEIALIDRDEIIHDINFVEECLKRVSEKLETVRNLLTKNDQAIYVRQIGINDFDHEYIDADDCEFVPQSFLDKFD